MKRLSESTLLKETNFLIRSTEQRFEIIAYDISLTIEYLDSYIIEEQEGLSKIKPQLQFLLNIIKLYLNFKSCFVNFPLNCSIVQIKYNFSQKSFFFRVSPAEVNKRVILDQAVGAVKVCALFVNFWSVLGLEMDQAQHYG